MYKQKNFSFHFIFIMLLYLIIVVLSFMIISLASNIYNKINQDRNTNYEIRVPLSYIANKLRQADKEGALEIKDLQGQNSVLINEVYDEEKYQTWIYFYDGAIYEIFTDTFTSFDLSDGIRIIETDLFEIEEIKDNLYKFTTVNDGIESQLYLSLYAN